MGSLCELRVEGSKQLSGPLPASWGALPVTDSLSLSGNSLSGTLPPEWGGAGLMPYVRALDLSSNLLKGTLPPAWFGRDAYPQLSQLDLSSNYLEGPLPPATGSYLQQNGTLILWPQLGVPSFCGGTSSFTVLTKWGAPAAVQISAPCSAEQAVHQDSRTVSSSGGAPLQGWRLYLVLGVVLGAVMFAAAATVTAWVLLRRRAQALKLQPSGKSDTSSKTAYAPPSLSMGKLSEGDSNESAFVEKLSTGDSSLMLSPNWTVGEISMSDLDFVRDSIGNLKLLGRGASGEVMLAKWRHTNVAVKVLREVDDSESQCLDFKREAQLLKELRHPNIVLFIGASFLPGQMVIVTEYCSGGSLAKAITAESAKGSHRLGWNTRGRIIALGVARGLAYLHSMRIVHHDIKPANILLDATMTIAKIGDLGVSRILAGTHATATVRGTLAYMAPECLNFGESTSFAVDMFSYGVFPARACDGRNS
eukprot:jgi/Botrbrau1/258/Bobra.0022s0229.1